MGGPTKQAVTHCLRPRLCGASKDSPPAPWRWPATRRLRSTELIIHRVRGWEESELATRAGIRLFTAVERTIADIAGSMKLGPSRSTCGRRQCAADSPPNAEISKHLAGLGRGPQGVAGLREVLAARRSGAPAESPLESMLDRCSCGGQTCRQRSGSTVSFMRAGSLPGSSFAWPAYRVAVEAQSRTRRADRTSFERMLCSDEHPAPSPPGRCSMSPWDDVHRRPRKRGVVREGAETGRAQAMRRARCTPESAESVPGARRRAFEYVEPEGLGPGRGARRCRCAGSGSGAHRPARRCRKSPSGRGAGT